MSDKTNPDTPESWDAASEGYATHVAPNMMESYADAFVELLDVKSTDQALEVAAGSGALTLTYAQSVRSLLATDFSPKMLDVLKRNVQDTGLQNVDFALMDGQALDLKDASFDKAACCFGLMLFPDKVRGFSELHRVLRPGGKAMVSAWAGPDKFEGFGLFLEAIQKAFPSMPKPDKPLPVFSLSDLGVFKKHMEYAGFKNVKIEMISRKIVIPNFEQLWVMFTAGAPPVQMLFDRVGEDGRQKIKDSLSALVHERYGGDPISFVNVATAASGSRSL